MESHNQDTGLKSMTNEALYKVEEFCTTGWEVLRENLTRSQASEYLQTLINEGTNPNHLRATRES